MSAWIILGFPFIGVGAYAAMASIVAAAEAADYGRPPDPLHLVKYGALFGVSFALVAFGIWVSTQ